MDAREWDEIAPELAQDWRVIRYDVRGHGRSAGATKPIAPHDDLRDLLDELHVSRASLVGLSMGSGIVLDAALAYPDRVDRVVMVSPTVSGVNTIVPFDWMAPIIAQVRAGAKDSAAALWWASASCSSRAWRRVSATIRSCWTTRASGARTRRIGCRSIRGRQRLESLKAPLLVIVGEHDVAAIRQLADLLTRRVPNAEALTMAGLVT